MAYKENFRGVRHTKREDGELGSILASGKSRFLVGNNEKGV